MPFLTNRKNKTPLGIYIHVPFCRSRCAYCDFCTQTDRSDKLIDAYLEAPLADAQPESLPNPREVALRIADLLQKSIILL